jgi:hypothetical protein
MTKHRNLAAWTLAAVCALSGACSKSHEQTEEQALTAAAIKAIEGTIQKPEVAYCDIKLGNDWTSRNDPDLLLGAGMRVELLCKKESASPSAQGCFTTLGAQKAAFTRDKTFPECLTVYDGRINRNDDGISGMRFRCGELTKVSVKKVEKLEAGRVRVTYSLDAKTTTDKVNAIERACGEVSPVPSEEKTALLLKEGEQWKVAGQ